MHVTPYKLINTSESARLRQVLTDIAESWGKHWLSETDGLSVQCSAAHTGAKSRTLDDTDEWREYTSPGTGSLYIATSSETLQRFAVLTFGAAVNHFDPSSSGPSHLLGGVFDKALSNLASRLCNAAMKDRSALPVARKAPPPAVTWTRGSAAAWVKWPLGSDWMDVVLSGSLIRDLLAGSSKSRANGEPLTRVRDCIETQAVTLQAWVGEVEIRLGLLHSLSPGDVIRLDASVHEPLQLSLSGVSTPVRAFLGSLGGRKALQVTPSY